MRVDSAKVEQVIIVEHVIGKGIDGDPVRRVRSIFTLDGELLAFIDKEAERIALQGIRA